MNKIILISDNYDLFNTNINLPEVETLSEIKTEAKPQVASNSEVSFVANKMAISFGVMLLSIVFLIIILLLVKKIKEKNRTIQNFVNKQVKVQTSKTKSSTNIKQCGLETPLTLKDAVNSFLNRTL